MKNSRMVFVILIVLSGGLCGQNSSEYSNNAPINGTDCSAFGSGALLQLNGPPADKNTALGHNALNSLLNQNLNTAIGNDALFYAQSDFNTAIGKEALFLETSANNANAACGYQALFNADNMQNTGIGFRAGPTINNIVFDNALGKSADFAAGCNASSAIGHNALVVSNDDIQLGDVNLLRIEAACPQFNLFSDKRYKVEISETEIKGIEFIKLLKVVDFNISPEKLFAIVSKNLSTERRNEIASGNYEAARQLKRCGFVAQDVEEAAQKSGYNFDGIIKPENDADVYKLNTTLLVIPLVKTVQEQQELIQECKIKIEQIEDHISKLVTDADSDFQVSKLEAGFLTIHVDLPEGVKNPKLRVFDLKGRLRDTYSINSHSEIKIPDPSVAMESFICAITGGERIIASKVIK